MFRVQVFTSLPRNTDPSTMATVVPLSSCYGGSPPLQLFGKAGRGSYMSMFSYRGPRCTPRPRLAGHAPRMTLRQICRMLKVMKEVSNREAAAAAARKSGPAVPPPPPLPSSPSPGAAKPDRKCVPTCLRHKRSIKRVG